MKNEVNEKTRENRREKPRPNEIRTTQFSGAKFAPPYPFARNCVCEHFPKSMLSVPTQNLSAKIHRNAKLVRNSHHPIRHSGKVASAGCKSYPEIRTTLLHWCEIRTTLPLVLNPLEPHFFAPLCLRPEEALPQLPRAARYYLWCRVS